MENNIKFIILHGMENDSVYININWIESFIREDSTKTRVYCSGNLTEYYQVKETPEEIIQLINN